MLKELHKVRQHPGEPRRRWFSNHEFDLIVWYDEQNCIGAFDLCYGKPLHQHVFRWRPPQPMEHLRVDDGEQRSGHHKMTPIYVTDASGDVDEALRTFILQRLDEMETP